MPSAHQLLFARLAELLAPFDPAELHGLLCGLLCANRDLAPKQWLNHASALLEDVELSQPTCDLLLKLFEYGAAQLNAPDYSIQLLLPDDDAPLSQRADALGNWCQGLLYGLGISDAVRRGDFSPESQEFLRDATDIAQAGFDADEATEADETAYVEVVEYLRVGLLLIQQDLSQLAAARQSRLH